MDPAPELAIQGWVAQRLPVHQNRNGQVEIHFISMAGGFTKPDLKRIFTVIGNMKLKAFISISYFLFALSSCQPKEQSPVTLKPADASSGIGERNEQADESFYTFLDRFNRDAAFQLNRVDFPLKGRVVNLGDEGSGPATLPDTIYLEEYGLKDFTYNEQEADKYDFTRTVQVNEAEATVEVAGKEHGLSATYTFRKVQGKWRLVWFEDMST